MATTGRPLGTTEENWSKATAGGTGIQVFGIALKRNVETSTLTQATREVIDRHAVLRAKITENPKGKLVYEVPPTGTATPSFEVFPWPASVGKTTASINLCGDSHDLSTALNHIVKEELNTPFPNASQKFTGPTDVFQVRVYAEPTEPKTIIVLRLVSGAVDRPGAVIVVQSFLSILNALVDGRKSQLPEAPGNVELLPALEDLVPKSKAKGFFQKGLDTVGYVASAGKFALYPFHSGYSESKTGQFRSDILSYTLGIDGTSALLAACEKEKTTIPAALTTAFLKGAATAEDLKSKKPNFNFTFVVDLRPFFEPGLAPNTVGNFSGGLSQDEVVKPEAEFWELARTISAGTVKELDKDRHFTEIPVMNMLFSQLLKRPNLTPKASLRTSLLSIFHKTLDARWKDTDKLQLAGTFGPFASMHGAGPCFCIGESLVEGPDLTISVVFPTPVYSRDQMESLANASLAILNAVTK